MVDKLDRGSDLLFNFALATRSNIGTDESAALSGALVLFTLLKFTLLKCEASHRIAVDNIKVFGVTLPRADKNPRLPDL